MCWYFLFLLNNVFDIGRIIIVDILYMERLGEFGHDRLKENYVNAEVRGSIKFKKI